MGQYLRKGTRILVEGRLQNNDYEKDGVKHYGFDVIVENVEFAGAKKDGVEKTAPVDDDMPF